MKELAKNFDPSVVEERLYNKWMEKKYFHTEVDKTKEPFCIVMPPPNITGQLHMGHALDNTMQDILIRWKRMAGYNALWVPGIDHASISTELKKFYCSFWGVPMEDFSQINREYDQLMLDLEEDLLSAIRYSADPLRAC